MLKQVSRFALILLLVSTAVPLHGCGDDSDHAPNPDAPESVSCNVNDNLDAIANDFISRCRKASIRQEFPSEYLDFTLYQIRDEGSRQSRKAWKLLTSQRFEK